MNRFSISLSSNQTQSTQKSTYTNQPVLLKVWNTKQRSLPSDPPSESHEITSPASADTLFSTLRPKSNHRISPTSLTNVTAWNPLELYHSTYLFRCFVFAPSHPRRTTVTSRWSPIPKPSPPFAATAGDARLQFNTASFEGEIGELEWFLGFSDENGRQCLKGFGSEGGNAGERQKGENEAREIGSFGGCWSLRGKTTEDGVVLANRRRLRLSTVVLENILTGASMAEVCWDWTSRNIIGTV